MVALIVPGGGQSSGSTKYLLSPPWQEKKEQHLTSTLQHGNTEFLYKLPLGLSFQDESSNSLFNFLTLLWNNSL